MYLQLSGQVVVVLLESWGNFKQITDCSFGRIFFYLHSAPNKPEMLLRQDQILPQLREAFTEVL